VKSVEKNQGTKKGRKKKVAGPGAAASAARGIRDRIVEFRRVPAGELAENPRNFRRHPQAQTDALAGILREIGVAGALLAYRSERAGGRLTLLDGHLRLKAGVEAWPTLILDLSDAEADKLLATFDAAGDMAELDEEALALLLKDLPFVEEESVQGLLEDLGEACGVFTVAGADAPEMPTGDRAPFQQMTFTLHDTQAAVVQEALRAAQAVGPFADMPNKNSHGNALARIAETYLGKC